MKNWASLVSSLIVIGLGTSILGAYLWTLTDQTSANLAQPRLVRVMRVSSGGTGSVILPRESVQFSDDQAYVMLVDAQETAQSRSVKAASWRSEYYRVEGLTGDELVVLENVPVGQKLSLNLINPEAGQSGAVER